MIWEDAIALCLLGISVVSTAAFVIAMIVDGIRNGW